MSEGSITVQDFQTGMLISEVIKSDRSAKSVCLDGGPMARGSKKKYTSKQKRKAHDIEKGYKKRGVSNKEAERCAWATINKSDKGGRKKGGGRPREKAKQIEFP